ncbi:MAG: hypothetical protein JWP57_2873 [Spirosoma sp.]|nr:hypothetical protein [Spirosoma sp.]
MDNLLKPGILVLMLVLSGRLTAQSTQPDLHTQQIYLVTDSLHSDPITADKFYFNWLKVSPISLILGQLSLFYERALTKRTSLVIGYGIGGNRPNFGRQLELGGGIYERVTLEGRRYWNSNRPSRSWYMGPYLRLSRLTVSEFILDQQGKALKDSQGLSLTKQEQALIWIPGLMAGGQWIKKRFCLDISYGLQRQIVVGSPAKGNQFVDSMTAKWASRLGLNVGVSF